ncbi:DUF1972 domain-containing protein [Penaeicola halotolerans]|uniref:DUF1972 domain-containing protein n=1 Tax=Penaeicola halotolerans TaxID=2793196 RepID=UPI001CF8331C|nr:DUF1972 domain-containing protein [Penaeicola halotolerans]
MKSKKIAIIGTVGVPSNYGGFETLVDNLLDHVNTDFDITVYCQSTAYKNHINDYKGAKLKYVNLKANGISSVFYDIYSILISVRSFDILLLLGVSGAIILPIIRPFYKGKIITNIDGLEWKRDKWGFIAQKFLKFSERLAVACSDIVVADNLFIQEHVSKNYNKKASLIAYGADHAVRTDQFSVDDKYGIDKEDYFFTVCRIEPENNLDMMVQAYEVSNIQRPYVIIGNFNSSIYGKDFKLKYQNVKGLKLLNPIYNVDLLNQFRSNCYYYLHGHSAGGTNPSLVEAMHIGAPVIAYGVNYNRATTFDEAIYFNNKEELASIFNNIDSIQRNSLKLKMNELAAAHYKWENICHSYIKLFNQI